MTTNTEEIERRREKGANDSAAVNNEQAKTPLRHSTASTYFLNTLNGCGAHHRSSGLQP
jgi:hypothetical protein